MNEKYWAGGYSLADLIKYCDNCGIDRNEIKLVVSVYDIDEKTNENRGAKMSEVQNFRLCLTDKYLELMIRKDNLAKVP